MTLLIPTGSDGALHFDLSAAHWLLGFRILDVEGTLDRQRSGPGESLLIVSSGTHDLFAGGGNWARRGLRPTPFAGRPVALFLPPDTPFHTEGGHGRLLLVTSRQPELAAPEDASEAASRKALLPLAGSGKSFDPKSGAWKPQEAFLGSSEALLPRRFVRLRTPDGLGVVERLAGGDYKALSLQVDETVLADGQSLNLPPADESVRAPLERAVYFDPEAELEVDGDRSHEPRLWFGGADAPLPAVRSRGGRCHVLVAYAGPKA